MRLLYNVNIHLLTQYTKINRMTDYFFYTPAKSPLG